MSLRKSTLLSGNKSIQTYERDGIELGVEPIKEYVRIVGYDLADGETRSLVTPESLTIRAAHVNFGLANSVTISIKDPANRTIYEVNLSDDSYLFNELLVEKGSSVDITSQGGVSDLIALVCVQSFILYNIGL